MKKLCGSFLAILFLISLTGCGSSSANEITCTSKEDDMKVVATVKTDKDDKIINVKMSTEIPAPSKEELDTTYEIMKAGSEEMNKNAGVKYNISKKDLTLIMDVEVDLNKVTDEVKSTLNMEEFNTTGTEFRKNAESNGATCK